MVPTAKFFCQLNRPFSRPKPPYRLGPRKMRDKNHPQRHTPNKLGWMYVLKGALRTMARDLKKQLHVVSVRPEEKMDSDNWWQENVEPAGSKVKRTANFFLKEGLAASFFFVVTTLKYQGELGESLTSCFGDTVRAWCEKDHEGVLGWCVE